MKAQQLQPSPHSSTSNPFHSDEWSNDSELSIDCQSTGQSLRFIRGRNKGKRKEEEALEWGNHPFFSGQLSMASIQNWKIQMLDTWLAWVAESSLAKKMLNSFLPFRTISLLLPYLVDTLLMLIQEEIERINHPIHYIEHRVLRIIMNRDIMLFQTSVPPPSLIIINTISIRSTQIHLPRPSRMPMRRRKSFDLLWIQILGPLSDSLLSSEWSCNWYNRSRNARNPPRGWWLVFTYHFALFSDFAQPSVLLNIFFKFHTRQRIIRKFHSLLSVSNGSMAWISKRQIQTASDSSRTIFSFSSTLVRLIETTMKSWKKRMEEQLMRRHRWLKWD